MQSLPRQLTKAKMLISKTPPSTNDLRGSLVGRMGGVVCPRLQPVIAGALDHLLSFAGLSTFCPSSLGLLGIGYNLVVFNVLSTFSKTSDTTSLKDITSYSGQLCPVFLP